MQAETLRPATTKKLSREDWARLWFAKLAQFHRIEEPQQWQFDERHVIGFLRSKMKAGMPAWKRLKVVEGLILYRNEVRRSSTPRLVPIRAKLKEIAFLEKHRGGEESIEEVVGRIDPREPDVIQQLRRTLRVQRREPNTEKAYVKWVRRFMKERCLANASDFRGIGAADVEAFLTELAVDGDVAPSTQSQAFYALLFLFEQVLKRDFGTVNALRARKPTLVPSVMSKAEVASVFDHLSGTYLLIAQLLYGCGMRISECMRLRVKDIRFDSLQIEVHNSKGKKSRLVPLPAQLVKPLRRLVDSRRVLHERDLEAGEASVWLPHALNRKYPSAHREFKWQFLFASDKLSRNPKTGKRHRHHLHMSTFPEHLKRAVKAAGVSKHVTSHTFRHSFATHLLVDGTDIRTIQELLGHKDVATTMIYTHVLNRQDVKVVSPLDRLPPSEQAGATAVEAESVQKPRVPQAETVGEPEAVQVQSVASDASKPAAEPTTPCRTARSDERIDRHGRADSPVPKTRRWWDRMVKRPLGVLADGAGGWLGASGLAFAAARHRAAD